VRRVAPAPRPVTVVRVVTVPAATRAVASPPPSAAPARPKRPAAAKPKPKPKKVAPARKPLPPARVVAGEPREAIVRAVVDGGVERLPLLAAALGLAAFAAASGGTAMTIRRELRA
jgi:hypothetical protein